MSSINVSERITDDVSFNLGFNRSDYYDRSDLLKLGLEIFKRSQYPLTPAWLLFIYLALVNGTGVILNGLICVWYYFKKNKKGIYTLILQIALSDLLLLTIVSVPELWSHQSGNWTFGLAICRLYLIFEVFAATSNIYFMTAMNLHSLAYANQKRRTISKDSEELLEDATEVRSSRRSLVSRDATLSLNRQATLENRTGSKVGVPVLLPLVFVWVLSVSLSVPEFPLSTVIDSRSGTSMCTFLEGYHLTSMQILLSVFQLFVPFVLLSTTSGMIVYKLYTMPKKNTEEIRLAMKISLFLCVVFLVFSAPRFMLATLQGLWMANKEGAVGLDRFVFPPLNYDVYPNSIPLILSFLHFLTPVVKPLGYIYFLRKSGKGLCRGSKNKSNAETS